VSPSNKPIACFQGYSQFSRSDSDTGAVQLMLNVQTAYSKPELLQPVVDRLVAEVPEVASIVNNVNESPGCGTVSWGVEFLFFMFTCWCF
jgi:hypothetical protein